MTEVMWRAICGVCSAGWKAGPMETNPAPNGSFCPDCQDKKMMAPGILNWFADKPPVLEDPDVRDRLAKIIATNRLASTSLIMSIDEVVGGKPWWKNYIDDAEVAIKFIKEELLNDTSNIQV